MSGRLGVTGLHSSSSCSSLVRDKYLKTIVVNVRNRVETIDAKNEEKKSLMSVRHEFMIQASYHRCDIVRNHKST